MKVDRPKTIALVTGASRGLGRSIALALAREGKKVYLHHRTQDEMAAEVQEEIASFGGESSPIRFDLREGEQVSEGLKSILQSEGRIDILINNAGICLDAPFALMSETSWDEVLAVNLKGPFLCVKEVVRPMMRQKSGVILNVASVAGLQGSAGQANYAASKAALINLTRSLAIELAPKGIRVNALVPGMIDVGMVHRTSRAVVEKRLGQIPMKRLGTSEEVAEVAAFLASEGARYITGQAIVVDGGMST